jgi:hypothetical protein
MNQKDIAKVEIKFYSTKLASVQFQSISQNSDNRNIQLLLLSLVNLINVIFNLKEEGQSLLNSIERVNQQGGNNIEFVSKDEIIEDDGSEFKELIKICLAEKNGLLYLESDSRNDVNPFYKYSSALLLLQAVLSLEDAELSKVLSESLEYILDYYNSNNPSELKAVLELSQYFSVLFSEYLK